MSACKPDRMKISLAASFDPEFQLLVGILDFDDGAVHEHTDGNGDAGERHDVRVQPHQVHGDKGQQHRHRNRDDRDDGRRDVPEEDQDHKADDDHLEDQLFFEIVDGAFDQFRAVIGGDDFHALGQGRLEFLEPLLDPADDLVGILAVPHHHDAAHRVAFSIQVGDAAPHLGSALNPGDVAQEDRGAAVVGFDDDLLDVLRVLDVSVAADHVLRAGELDQPCAHLDVGIAHRLRHHHERDVVGGQLFPIHGDLVLVLETADRGDFCHARDRLQRIAQVPILEGSQIGQRMGAALIHQGVLKNPSHAGSVRADLGLDSGGERRKHLAQVFEHTAPGPIDVGPVLENDVYVGKAEVRKASNRFDLGRAEQRRGNRIGDLIFDDVGRTIPLGVDDDLRIRKIGDGIHRLVVHRPDAEGHDSGGKEKNDVLLTRGKLNEFLNHTVPS